DDLRIGLQRCGERQFKPFFADFLRNAPDARLEKLRRVAARRAFGDALRDDVLEFSEKGQRLRKALRRVLAPAGRGTQMAGGPSRLRQYQERVAVAVGGDAAHIEEMARCFPLG